MNFENQLKILIDRFLTPIDDPTSRLFYLNFIFVIVFIIIWMLLTHQSISRLTFRKIFLQKKYWWNRSTRVDYKIYLLNSVLKVFLFIPLLDISFFVGSYTFKILQSLNDNFDPLKTTTLHIFIFSVAYFVFDDFLRFVHHYGMHKVPFLWKLHKVHHSARILTPVTLYRAHPLESALATLRNSLGLGVTTGLFVFLFQSQLQMTTILGINFMGFMFNFLGSNLRHSHIPISFGKLEYLFISPKQHQIHHSTNPLYFDSNFGVSLSIWDQIFKCFHSSKDVKNLRFGL